MIFSQQERFDSRRLDSLVEEDDEGEEQQRPKSRMFMPASTLSERGTKIVDSYGQMGNYIFLSLLLLFFLYLFLTVLFYSGLFPV